MSDEWYVNQRERIGAAVDAHRAEWADKYPDQCTCGTPWGRCHARGRMVAYNGWQQVRCEEHTPKGATFPTEESHT